MLKSAGARAGSSTACTTAGAATGEISGASPSGAAALWLSAARKQKLVQTTESMWRDCGISDWLGGAAAGKVSDATPSAAETCWSRQEKAGWGQSRCQARKWSQQI